MFILYGALGALVGIVAVAFIAFIIAVAIKSVADMEREEVERTRVFTLETGEVVERKYGNTYATMDGKEYERVASDKFCEK